MQGDSVPNPGQTPPAAHPPAQYQPAQYQPPPTWGGPYAVPAVPAPVKPKRAGALVMIGIAIVAMLAAVGVAGAALANKPTAPEACCSDGLSVRTAGGSITAGSSSTAAVPAATCVVGSWKATKESMDAKTYWTNVGGKLTAKGTHTVEFRADGTATETYKNWTAVGSAYGSTITVTVNGTYEFAYEVNGNKLQYVEVTKANLTYHWQQSGGGTNKTRTEKETGLLGFSTAFSCKGATSTENAGSQNHHVTTWTRTSGYGVYQ